MSTVKAARPEQAVERRMDAQPKMGRRAVVRSVLALPLMTVAAVPWVGSAGVVIRDGWILSKAD